jgi:hypothetical protein
MNNLGFNPNFEVEIINKPFNLLFRLNATGIIVSKAA